MAADKKEFDAELTRTKRAGQEGQDPKHENIDDLDETQLEMLEDLSCSRDMDIKKSLVLAMKVALAELENE